MIGKVMELSGLSAQFGRLFTLPRVYKRALQVSTDSILLFASFTLAMALRLESLQFMSDWRNWATLAVILPITIAAFVMLGFYRALIRYMTQRAVTSILKGLAVSTLALIVVGAQFNAEIPLSVPVLYFLLSFGTVGGVRFAARAMFYRNLSRAKARVIIYGAGQSGRRLAHALFQGPDYAPVAFVDDAPDLQGAQVVGLKVFSPAQLDHLINDYAAKVLLLAIPSASPARRAEILASLEPLPIHVQTVPSFDRQIKGKGASEEIREIAIEDLLGRDEVPADPALLSRNLTGQVVLVTGAGGSVGGELSVSILQQAPRKLILVEISELALYNITERLEMVQAELGSKVPVVSALCSVLDRSRIEDLMRRHGVTTVFHAAAYKHVPLVESNPITGLRNNVFGTLETLHAAAATGVSSFTLVSTDKAVRPTSVMGASKRLAELVCLAPPQSAADLRVSIVRFGNVMGSSGSVIPLFKRQIARGGPVEVTHPGATRYFMTMAEAANLVIQAGALARRSGSLFVLEMGQPVNILNLAKRMIRLYGLVPRVIGKEAANETPRNRDEIEIIFTGLRPGEKLTEELTMEGGLESTPHPRIFTTREAGLDARLLDPMLKRLEEACESDDITALMATLRHPAIGLGPERPRKSQDPARRLAVNREAEQILPLAGE